MSSSKDLAKECRRHRIATMRAKKNKKSDAIEGTIINFQIIMVDGYDSEPEIEHWNNVNCYDVQLSTSHIHKNKKSLPAELVRQSILPNKPRSCVLRDVIKRRRYFCEYYWSTRTDSECSFIIGWLDFVKDNELDNTNWVRFYIKKNDSSLFHHEDCLHTGDGSVNIKGKLAVKKKTGTWKACPYVLGTFFCERLAYYGIASNLVTHLTTKLHEKKIFAAKNVNTFQGTSYLTPLIGSFFADAYWGRYWTIVVFYGVYLIGICTLIVSASIPALEPVECVKSVCPPATSSQKGVFFLGLYLISLGTGGIKPCIWPFGADQFDDTDQKEKAIKGSFFNWNYFTSNIGALVATTVLVWIEENVGWGLGYGIAASFIAIGIMIFFLGTPKYRLHRPHGSPLTRICQVIVASLCKWKLKVPQDSCLLYEVEMKNSSIELIEGSRKLEHSNGLRCLDKAAVMSDAEKECVEATNPWRLCTVTQVEEVKILVRMFPIWATGIIFCAVYAQMSSLFVVQGKVMHATIGSFKIPAASLSTFNIIGVIIWVVIYDRGIVPIARKFTGNERGFTELQRMGIGLFISIICMLTAGILEYKRLQIAKELGLVVKNVPVPLSIFWQVPQYFFLGAAEVFTFVGQHEFFYEQAPDSMRSFCSALALLTNSLGNYLSTFILTIVANITTNGGKSGWIPDNLNKGHVDYFFWLLAGLSFLNMLVYIVFARRYKQKSYHRT